MAVTHKLVLDVHKRMPVGQQRVVVRQGEAGTQQIEAAITKDGEPYASSCTGVRLEVLHADGTWTRVTAAKSGATATVVLPSDAVSVGGICKLAYFAFFTGTGVVETTEGFELRILPAVDVSGEQSKPYSDEIEALLAKLKEQLAEAKAQEAERAKAQKANDAAQQKNDAAQKGNDSAAALAAQAARDAASGASAQAAAARSAAQQATAAARLAKPYFIQGSEPPYADRVNGCAWMQTDGSRIASINRWDASLQGAALFPQASTYPQSTTYPAPKGAWSKFSV